MPSCKYGGQCPPYEACVSNAGGAGTASLLSGVPG